MLTPDRVALPPEERALAGLASLVTEAPWSVEAADFDRARGVGMSDATLLHVVLQAAFFNYLNRVADGLGIEYDYPATLPAMPRGDRRAMPRPPRAAWPVPRAEPSLALAQRPATAALFGTWAAYVSERDAPLGRRERDVLRRAAAFALCDAATTDELSDAEPRTTRETRLADYATRLTVTPWLSDRVALDVVRAEGLDDVTLLDLVAVVAFQSMASRARLALGAS